MLRRRSYRRLLSRLYWHNPAWRSDVTERYAGMNNDISPMPPAEVQRRPDDAIDPATGATEPLADGTEKRMELREERLKITKEPVQAAVARVRRVVSDWTETVTVPLHREQVVIEVLPGGGTVEVDGRVLQPGETCEITIVEERANVTKETVVLGSVSIRKESVEFEETIQERLRREELVVDEDDNLEVHEETLSAPAEHAGRGL